MSGLLVITKDDIIDGWYRHHDLTHDGPVSIRCSIDVRGSLYVRGSLDAVGSLYAGGSLDASGSLDVGADLDVGGSLDVVADLDVGGSLYVGGNLDVGGNASYARRSMQHWCVGGVELDRSMTDTTAASPVAAREDFNRR